MKHTISYDDVEVYSFTHQIAAAFGKDINKSLEAAVTGSIVTYEVKSDKRVVFETDSLMKAIDRYNSI